MLKAGDAKLSVRGSLLGEHQDASLLLTDFPMTTLRPIFRWVLLPGWIGCQLLRAEWQSLLPAGSHPCLLAQD